MRLSKIAAAAVCASLLSGAYAQSSRSERNVEDEYLNTIDDAIVTELANANDRDNKLLALNMLESAANEGTISADKHHALISLAGEGVTSESRMNGRIMNNFPDVRARACEILAKVPSEESKDALKKITLIDNEPMVLSAAIRALGDIGINDKDEVIETIAWTQHRLAVLNPTSSLAFDILEAYEKLAPTVENNKVMIASVTEIASNQRFVPSVRQKAQSLLKQLMNK